MNTIRINFKKSDRKNAKSEIKELFLDSSHKLKERDIVVILDEIVVKSQKYKNIYFTFIKGGVNITTSKRYSIEQYINDIYVLLELATNKEFEISLKELYNKNHSIKYLIKKYYNMPLI